MHADFICLSTFPLHQVLEEAGSGVIDEAYVFPPHVVKYAGHTIASGVLITVWGGMLASSLIDYENTISFTCLWGILIWYSFLLTAAYMICTSRCLLSQLSRRVFFHFRVWLLCGEVLTQVSLAARDSSDFVAATAWAAAAAQLVGLLTVLVFAPLFALGELKRERVHEEEADVATQGEFRADVVKLSGDKQYEGARGSIGGL
jgi:hypothetical protein